MASTPARSRAKRTPYLSMADQLYPEDGQQDTVTDGPEEYGPEEDGADDDASGANPAKPLSQQEMADKVYPADAKGEDGAEGTDADGEGVSVDDEDSGDDGADDEDKPAQGERGPAAQSAVGRMNGVCRMIGADAGDQGGKDPVAADVRARLEAGMRKAIADAETKNGAPLSASEEENISGEYIADHADALKWLRLRNLSESMWKAAGENPNAKCGHFFHVQFEGKGGNLSGLKSASVKDWGPALEQNGYRPVSMKDYEPQDGDIRIYGAVTPRDPQNPKAAEIHGHIQVYNARQGKWVSEYKQNQDIPPAFQRKDAKFVTYRLSSPF